MQKKKEKFDPKEPMELAMERLEPVYGSDGQRERAKTNSSVVEEGKRAAYAILRDSALAVKKPKEGADE